MWAVVGASALLALYHPWWRGKKQELPRKEDEMRDTRQLRREAGYDPRFLRLGWGPWTRCTRCGKEATDLYQDEPICIQCLREKGLVDKAG